MLAKGKTMLLCGIINELELAGHSGHLSFFFCQGTDSWHNNATAVLRGLIYLLLIEQELLIPHLQTKYDSVGKKLFEGGNAFYDLSDILKNMLQNQGLPTVYLIVDALDECKEGLLQLLGLVKKITSTTCTRVKLIISSRNRPDIDQQLPLDDSGMRLSLEINAPLVSHAIDVYIDHQISQLRLIKDD